MAPEHTRPVAFVIHDRKRMDREELMMQESINQGFEITWFPPVVGLKTTRANVNAAHKQVVRYAQAQGLKEALIMEDDVEFLGAGALQRFLSSKPQDFDLYLSGVYSGMVKSDGTVQGFAGMQCYIIHERYYATFLSSNERRDIDRAQGEQGRFIVCIPFAAIQHETWSDHNGSVLDNKKHLEKYSKYINL